MKQEANMQMINTIGSAERVGVIVVEGAEFVRRGICDVVTQHGAPFEVAAEFGQTDALPQACELLTPDIIVLSLRNDAGRASQLRSLRRALEVRPGARAIVLLDRDGADAVIEVVQAGASGVLLREASASTLLAAIGEVLSGGAVLEPRLARSLFARIAAGVGAAQPGYLAADIAPAIRGVLSTREREVLVALARGFRNKEISAELGVSVGTVKTHLRHIFRKLDVADRTAAVLIALHGELPRVA